MGITGLLPFVKKASRPCFLHEFPGKVAAVDTYCWLHKGAFSCADKLVRGEETDGYVIYVMKLVRLLLSHRIKPVMVFDGCNLPSKAGTEAKRRESRAKNRALAKEMLREGRVREARECYQRCVDVTSQMARAVMKACREVNVDVIVAPYEADAQLAYLALEGFADLVITEDSDLLLFGCEKVIFKMDSHGGGVLVEQQKLHLALGLPPDKFSLELFRNVCILSGCDYLPSLPGIGLSKASKFFSLTSNTDVYNVLCKLPAYLKMPQLEVTTEYRTNFVQAVNTFLYQLVFCPRDRVLRPLIQYQDGSDWSDHPYAGAHFGHDRALAIALGNIDVQSGEVVDNFDPDKHKARPIKSSCWGKTGDLVAEFLSVWDPTYDKTKVHAKHRSATESGTGKGAKVSALAVNETKKPTKSGQHNKDDSPKVPSKAAKPVKVIDIVKMFSKRKREDSKTEDNVASKQTDELLALYGCGRKSPKKMRASKSITPLSTDQPALSNSNERVCGTFKQEQVFNPFAKKLTLASVQNLSPVKDSSTSPSLQSTRDFDIPVDKSQLETVHGHDNFEKKITGADISVYTLSPENATDSTDRQDVLKVVSEISSGNSPKNAPENNGGDRSILSSFLRTSNEKSNGINATSLAASRRIILKSKYFRPIDSSDAEQGLEQPQALPLLDHNSHVRKGDTDCHETASNFSTKADHDSYVDAFPQSDPSCDEPTDGSKAFARVRDEVVLLTGENVCKLKNSRKTQLDNDSEDTALKSQRTHRLEGSRNESLEDFQQEFGRTDECAKDASDPESQGPDDSQQGKRCIVSHEVASNCTVKSAETTALSQESSTFSCSIDSESFGFTPLSQSVLGSSQGSYTAVGSSQCSVDKHEFSDLKASEDQLSVTQTAESSATDVCKGNALSYLECENIDLQQIPSGDGQFADTGDRAVNYNTTTSNLISLASNDVSTFDGTTAQHHSKPRPSLAESTHSESLKNSETSSESVSQMFSRRKTSTSGPNTPKSSREEISTFSKEDTSLPGQETPKPSVIDSQLFCAISPASLRSESLLTSYGESQRLNIPKSATTDLPEITVLSTSKSPVFSRRCSTVISPSQILAPIENTSDGLASTAPDRKSSPYFSSPATSSKLSGCRRPGLSRPSRGTTTSARGKGWRQLDLRDMFAARR